MQDKYIANLLGNSYIYPVTIFEMVGVLKLLIDEYRRQAGKSNNEKILKALTRQIKLYKRQEPALFARSRRYLRAKRKKLLRIILSRKFPK